MKDYSVYIDRAHETYDLYFYDVGLRPSPEAYPAACMSLGTAEALMRELWAHGIRPAESQYQPAVAGVVELKADDREVAAMRRHIADLRAICFHGLGVKKGGGK